MSSSERQGIKAHAWLQKPDVSARVSESNEVPRGELTSHRPNIRSLTGIRLFAAFYVVFFHSRLPSALAAIGWRSGAFFISNGYLAVQLFFMLSGFILAYTYAGQVEQRHEKRRFWEARVARVWPLYFVSLLFSSIAFHKVPPLPYAVATLVMVQAWNPLNSGMAGSWNFVCWTLSTEALFYLTFPFLQRLIEKLSVVWQMAILLSVLAIAIRFDTGSLNFVEMHGIKAIPLALTHLPEFIAGVCLGNLYLRRAWRAAKRPLYGSTLVQSGAATWCGAVASVFVLSHQRHAYTSWTALSFAVLIFGLASETSVLQRLLSTPLIQMGGRISYGVYLLQWPCKQEVNRACDFLGVRSMGARFTLDCVCLTLISAIGFYYVEEPARKGLRAGFARFERDLNQ